MLILNEDFIKNRVLVTNFIFYFGYFYIIFSILFFYWFYKLNSNWKFFALFLGILFLLLFYGQFIERFWIKETIYNLNQNKWKTKIVLISDLHLGIYKNREFLKKVVDKINRIKNVDFVLIAGDLTFWPQDLEKEFQELKKIKYPVYAVVGNHDVVQSKKISFKKELTKVLEENNVIVLDNKDIIAKNNIHIFGLGSHFAKEDNVEILKNARPKEEKTILLFHNPDTSLKKYPENIDFSNTFSFVGHTHCGQLRIPLLYKIAIPVRGNFYKKGLYDLEKKGKMVISCGLGESGIPIRLFNRPEITIINL